MVRCDQLAVPSSPTALCITCTGIASSRAAWLPPSTPEFWLVPPAVVAAARVILASLGRTAALRTACCALAWCFLVIPVSALVAPVMADPVPAVVPVVVVPVVPVVPVVVVPVVPVVPVVVVPVVPGVPVVVGPGVAVAGVEVPHRGARPG